MKPRLIILSDLWGKSKTNWEQSYINFFQKDYTVQYYDCCELGNVDKSNYSQNALHQQFINGGIEIAVEKLLQLEQEKVFVIAFSIGGTIAWKAALKGLKIDQLIALSATRLRYETEKPSCNIQLFYGENDRFQPQQNWFEKMNIQPKIIQNVEHEFYQTFKSQLWK